VHFLQPAHTVIAHTGHDDAHGVLAGKACRRKEQYINRRPAPADRGAVDDIHHVLNSAAFELNVTAPGSNQHLAGQHPVSVTRLPYVDLTERIEQPGKCASEPLGHMNNDNNARGVLWQGTQHGFQSAGPAGRRTHHHHRPDARGQAPIRVVRRRRLGHVPITHQPHAGFGCRSDCMQQIVRKIRRGVQGEFGGPGDSAHGACAQSVECQFGTLFGRGCGNHNRDGAFVQNLSEQGQAIQVR
jgi:hypothetical protein